MRPRHLKTAASLINNRPLSKVQQIGNLLNSSCHPASYFNYLQSILINAPQLQDFLQTICTPPESQWSVAIGNRPTHSSHRLRTYGVVDICNKCGALSRNKIRNLALPCGDPTPGGRNNLKAYSSNRPPVNCPGWPYNRASLQYKCVVHKIHLK